MKGKTLTGVIETTVQINHVSHMKNARFIVHCRVISMPSALELSHAILSKVLVVICFDFVMALDKIATHLN